MKEISASEFKARCLALLDHVSNTGEVITVLKRGKPVAQVVPPVPREGSFPQDALHGSVRILGDVLQPVVEPDEWEAEKGR